MDFFDHLVAYRSYVNQNAEESRKRAWGDYYGRIHRKATWKSAKRIKKRFKDSTFISRSSYDLGENFFSDREGTYLGQPSLDLSRFEPPVCSTGGKTEIRFLISMRGFDYEYRNQHRQVYPQAILIEEIRKKGGIPLTAEEMTSFALEYPEIVDLVIHDFGKSMHALGSIHSRIRGRYITDAFLEITYNRYHGVRRLAWLSPCHDLYEPGAVFPYKVKLSAT